MPMESGRFSGDANVHSHSGDCQEKLSGKYAEYIELHRQALMEKCARVNNCIERLLKDENILLLLKGDNLSLNKTCGLIYDNSLDTNVQSGKCTSDDREDIRDDLEQHLILQFDDVKSSGWRNVKRCLSNEYGDAERTTYVNDICRLAQKQPQICESRNIHKNVTTFFNNQIQHLQCTCRNLQKREDSQSKISLPVLIGGVVGGLLLLIAILAIIFICYRQRKSKQSKKHAPNVIYLPAPNADNCPVYQELYDDQTYQGHGKYPSGNPPTLPSRFSKQSTGQEDEPAYLEPVQAGFRFRPQVPFPSQDNPSYGAPPPKYSEKDTENKTLTTNEAETEYFQLLPSPPRNRSSDKTKPGPDLSTGYETIEAVLSSQTEENPKFAGAPQGPTPAKRSSRNSGREEASRYVMLEQEQGQKKLDSTV